MKKIVAFITFFIFLFSATVISYAVDEAYLIGGGGASGQGTNDNGWVITSTGGGYIYDAEGLRIYLVDSKTGEPIAGKNVIDITNDEVEKENVINMINSITGKKVTKYEYLIDKKEEKKSYELNKSYSYKYYTYSKIPLIIPWNGYPDSVSRIKELKDWLLDLNIANNLCILVGSDLETVKKEKWYLAIEPIAYIRCDGKNIAMTATEYAIYNQEVKNFLYNKMNPLTHNNLPLSFFLDRTLFKTAAMPMNKWGGSYTANASDSDIINSLGIGYINYNSPTGTAEDEEEEEIPPPPPEDVFIDFKLSAEPKEYEVKSDVPGVPVSIGKDAVITVDLEQTIDNINKWTDRLKGVSTVEVTMLLKKTPIESGTSNLKCNTNSDYSLVASTSKTFNLSPNKFTSLLKGKKLSYTDPCGIVMIRPGETKTYNYEFSMSVKFIEAGEYSTKGKTITISALTPDGERIGKDYSSFFRENDPPDYVTYMSNPVAYSEIKQGTIGNEQFEAMAGTPTTRDLYFGVGGSEFIVDFKAEYKKYNTAKRTYKVHYDETECEFKEADNSKTHTLGGITVNTHTGGSYVAAQTWSGNHSHSQNPANCGTCGASGYSACTLNTSAYNSALAQATAYAAQINGTVLTWTAGSDNVTRTKSGWGASPSTTQNDTSSNARGATGGSGCLHGGSCSIVGTPTNPHSHSGGNCSAGSQCSNSHAWRIEVRFNVSQDVICGKCCRHDLPAVNDTWTQEIIYDYFDAVKMSVWKLEQGYLNGLGTITGGTNSVLTSILQGNPNLFYNIANSETSRQGRFRYSLEAGQHDTVVWNKGTRTNKCDKQNETWGTGIKYNVTSYPHESGYLESHASDKDKLTAEYAEFMANRKKLVTATVISDFLILQTSSGDQSVLYYQKQSNSVQAQEDFNYVEFARSEGWDNNSKSAAKWNTNHINTGSYNGKYGTPSSKYNGSGSGSAVSTIFDNDPAGTVTRTTKPSNRLLIAKYDINVKDTLPNNDYQTGSATAFWELKLNYNPENLIQKYGVSGQSLFGNKTGHIKTAPYSPKDIKINDIVIHNPVSSEYAMVLGTDENRDQRVSSSSWALQKSSAVTECPSNPAECEHSYLKCTYTGTSYHTAACYSTPTTQTLNAHDHTAACINSVKMGEAIQIVADTKTFNYTGNVQTFTAPVTATYTFELWGAQGGTRPGGGTGGLGGYSKGTYNLTAGQTINIYVGGQPTGTTGGWNGGGSTGGEAFGGGGASDVRINGAALNNRIIVAGGGGGAQAGNGGAGGGTIGSSGTGSYGTAGTGGTQTSGGTGGSSEGNGSFGQGGNGTTGTDGNYGGGGGGGYYGGGGSVSDYSSIDDKGGAGGSGYIGGVAGGSMQSGVNSGNGKVTITYSSNKRVGDDWGLVDLNEIVSGSNVNITVEWIAKQPTNSVIFKCGGMPYTRHVCNSSCSHSSVLICTEPHHDGEHYDISSTVCWSACKDNSKHANKTTGVAGSNAANSKMGYFISLDWGFQIYFPTIGDFYQNGAYGISKLTSQRGKGFVNNMQTSEWVAKKRVKFSFDVIYCGETTVINPNGSQHGNAANGSDNHKHTSSCRLYKSGTWIDLAKNYEIFNFYCVGANSETAASSVVFEVTAINAPNLENDNNVPTNRLRNIAFEAKHVR